VSYSPNKTAGQWKAHGRYLARESATPDQSSGFGFGSSEKPIPIAATLDQWQKCSDERLFKLIISPEFGDRLDLEKLTRELMAKKEMDLGTRLEWVATVHDNTQFPHVHVALRGVRDDGRPLRLDRTYIQHGIRANAQDAATAQIGYRTTLDAQEAERREIHQMRYTSLDRLLSRTGAPSPQNSDRSGYFEVDPTQQRDKIRQHTLQSRLIFLGTMGLADNLDSKSWRVRSDFETVLRAMQRANDRQRTLAAHNSLLSDVRLQSRVTDFAKVEQLEGRVLGHGEDESNGRAYMLLEGTDHNVHFIYHSAEMERARQNSELRTNSFVRMIRQKDDNISIQDFGDAERLLHNTQYFRGKAQVLISRGILPLETGIGGWLGKYEAALVHAVGDIQQKEDKLVNRKVPPHRGR
jgi:type IV secretory pathway VirD2 relaxase